MDEPLPAAKLRIPRSGADGKGARRGPRAESPIARGGSGRGALAFLGAQASRPLPSTTNGKAGGQPMLPLSLDPKSIGKAGRGA